MYRPVASNWPLPILLAFVGCNESEVLGPEEQAPPPSSVLSLSLNSQAMTADRTWGVREREVVGLFTPAFLDLSAVSRFLWRSVWTPRWPARTGSAATRGSSESLGKCRHHIPIPSIKARSQLQAVPSVNGTRGEVKSGVSIREVSPLRHGSIVSLRGDSRSGSALHRKEGSTVLGYLFYPCTANSPTPVGRHSA